LLLSAGVDVDARDAEGTTALIAAATERSMLVSLLAGDADRSEIVALLLAAGADVAARDKDGATPLHLATSHNDRTVTLLLAAGADVTLRDARGLTPLHRAVGRAENGCAAVIEMVLAAGSDVNTRDGDGRTPLHLAKTAALCQLLDAGADPNLRDSIGLTPLGRFCSDAGSPFGTAHEKAELSAMCAVLLERGADACATADDGLTPRQRIDAALVKAAPTDRTPRRRLAALRELLLEWEGKPRALPQE
jgi:ankyrin repeat protein